MQPIKFIHTGDLHLGQRVHWTGVPSKEVQSIMNQAVFESFRRLCTIAQNEAVDFVLIAGDVYDSTSRSVLANQFFIQQCRQLEQYHIAVYIIAGNHDPLNEGQELFDLPANVVIFKGTEPQMIEHKRGGQPVAMIIGQSYQRKWEKKKMHQAYRIPSSDLPIIAMLHTQLSLNDSRYVPASINELNEQNSIDYWALGHIHKQQIIQAIHPFIAYCGTPQGTNFGELGYGGALLVEMASKKEVDIKSIKVAAIRIEEAVVDLTNRQCETLSKLEDYILKQTEPYIENQQNEQGVMLQWRITGKTKLKKVIDGHDDREIESALLESLNHQNMMTGEPFIWHNGLSFHLQNPINFERLKQENEIYGQIEAITNGLINKGFDDEIIEIMGQIWNKDLKEEGLKGKQLTMDQSLYKDIIQEASQLVIEALAERRMLDEN